ncbi:geranyl-CoA carboxylase alpha subunit [Enhydrobacter aerosaccus]|uniref:Geranyl-CoA carboxylase alpha subunit n=1 Tax=Enhydrobacter aerosaccus TaxID=225324 RepID=A0A1T4RY74_9HYPH|nr:acetyl-CoA carboxylase biotin carboxylase subunit [Enhydrobacter aerosaccus]SKA20923.1 geranyl-CoA carboxylase alpha subunit [Enhydrobacter aerosaccus]
MTTSFSKILVANRAEIAWRIMRTAKAMGYRTVAAYSDADREAPHVAFADEAVRIGPPPVGESYLDIDRVLDAARQTGADAIHPGYGFLSENERFASACEKMGLVFIGPPASAIAAMGNKAAAKRRMIEAGVPCVPGYQGADQSDATLEQEARKIGLPVMVKAAAGGGGRGMRLVEQEAQLAEAIRTARAEAENAFGSGELILEKAVIDGRHVEIQVFADSQGNVIHLGERDCSVQRRHQKVIEEAPSPAVDPDLRQRMGAAAVAAAKAVGYRGAGTVEFLLGSDGAFYFLEMNTRLQVEHPVTEAITGLDLVEWQIRVARGEALPLSQADIRLDGHAIEVRLYAEDPYAGFLPQTGRIDVWRPASGPSIRIDHGMTDGLAISPFYDPMIAKVIAYGATREQARTRLVRALQETVVLGPTTNRHFLIRLLEHPAFAAGQATTAFIGRYFAGDALKPPEVTDQHWQLAASLLWHESAKRYPPAFRGWRNSNPEPTPIKLAVGDVERAMTVAATTPVPATLPFHIDGRQIIVDLDGHTVRFEDRTYMPPAAAAAGSDGKLRAPMDGRIVSVKVAPGNTVIKGQTMIVLEAMKIQHQLKAAFDARVESIAVQEGQQVSNRTVLLTLATEAAA